jgi:transmembrane sensor
MSWRVPRIEFTATPLADAVPLVARYSNLRIAFGDPELANVRVSGLLRADNMDMLLTLLQQSYGMRVEQRSAGDIVLWRAR